MNLYACLPADSARTGTNLSTVDDTQDNNNDTSSGGTTTGNLVLKLGTNSTQGVLNIAQDYSGNFVIQGSVVNDYIQSNLQTDFCLGLRFPGTNEIYLAYAVKQSFFNFSTASQEYVWLINPNDLTTNTNKCSPINSQVALSYGIAVAPTVSYDLSNACQNCSSRTTESLKVFNTSGIAITEIPFQNHKLSILSTGSSSGGSGSVCSNGAGCPTGKCCVTSQCVSHGQIKPGTNEADPTFIQIYQNILNGIDTFANNQQYFYVCADGSGGNQNGGNSGNNGNQTNQSQVLIDQLGEYLACTLGDIDEQGICTIRYENAKDLIDPNNDPIPAGANFVARNDDLNFSNVNNQISPLVQNIVEIIYGGEVLYHETNQPILDPSDGNFVGSPNDDLNNASQVLIKAKLSDQATDDTLIIKYKTDVSCSKQGNSFTRCIKFFNIGQSSTPARPSDHPFGINTFLLPQYADVVAFKSAIIVEVDNFIVPLGPTTWQWDNGNPYQLNFIQPLQSGQKLKITYFVQSAFANIVGESSDFAQNAIASYCGQANNADITLVPIITQQNGQDVITGYDCQASSGDGIPVEQVVEVSSKSAPHLYYDIGGILKNEDQLSEALDQEGDRFEYTGGDLLKPNNQDQYVGFNEIYGSFDTNGGARPAKEVEVKEGKLYIISTEQGAYSPCPNCGNDYYSNLVRIFPHNFSYRGGGIKPDLNIATRDVSFDSIRSDDFLYGRACFIPATMIPWTHKQDTSVTNQRRNRLKAQHFLFANGYQRDWYGFDYGSLIGSFDGVTWFSIGNRRRIAAKSGKLYLAINGYFSDVALTNNFKIRVSEVLYSTNDDIPDHDNETDGAECQKAHYCDTDNDCLTQLGYDYACINVNEIYTNWPITNNQGLETLGFKNQRLSTLLGGTNGQNKRCVYRGAGALCSLNNTAPGSNSPYSSSSAPLHTCSTNSHCSPISSAQFNDRIARYARAPLAQNSSSSIPTDSDLLGLGARILGRPYNYRGLQNMEGALQAHFNSLNGFGICTPGRRAEFGAAANFSAQHTLTPALFEHSKILNTGSTPTPITGAYPSYLSSCPVTDDSGNYFHSQIADLTSTSVITKAVTQNMASNLLSHPDLSGTNIFNDLNQPLPTTEKGLRRNTCLRAPGASCFSDMECAPNTLLAARAQNINPQSMNDAEIDFWREGLICGQKEEPRSISNILNPNENYDLNENRCCRETGKKITIYSNDHQSPIFDSERIAGIDLSLDSNQRYSRLHTIYDRMSNGESKGLRKPAPDSGDTGMSLNDLDGIQSLLRSYEDFHAIASRTCCSQNWVRNFHQDNGGGHKWASGKMQSIDKSTLKTIAWNPKQPGVDSCTALDPFSPDCAATPGFTCTPENFNTAQCTISNITAQEEEVYLNFFASLELTGIPQIPIAQIPALIQEDGNPIPPAATNPFIPKTITLEPNNGHEIVDNLTSPNERFYSAMEDNNNYASEIKNVFSENEFSCCQANGETTSTESRCCSGTAAQSGGDLICCMPDYTNMSVYLNRYVSSEAANLPDNMFDEKTGYFNDPEAALAIAANMCCSRRAGFGVAVSPLAIPGVETEGTKRFLYRTSDALPLGVDPPDGISANGIVFEFDSGRRWNNQIYCLPASGGGNGNSSGQ